MAYHWTSVVSCYNQTLYCLEIGVGGLHASSSWLACSSDALDSLWPPYVIGQAIIFLPCGFFFYLYFFLAYSQPLEIGCLPYFHTWCGLSANLGCRPETSCALLAVNTGCKKNRHKFVICAPSYNFGTIVQLCRSISSQLRHVSTVKRKLVKQQYLPPPHVLTIWWSLAH